MLYDVFICHASEDKDDFEALIAAALSTLGISESVATISRRFIEGGFVEGYYDEEEKIQEKRKRTRKATGASGSKDND